MLWLGFSIYSIFLVFIFGFFIVAKIHIYKFRHYNVHIEPITKLLAITLSLLALIGYYLLFSSNTNTVSTKTVEQTTNVEIY